jgi:hypothetical protein
MVRRPGAKGCATIKQLADIRPLAIDDTDSIIRSFYLDLQNEQNERNGIET